MTRDRESAVRELIQFGRKANEKELVWGPSGNISCRLDEETFLITKKGARLGDLSEEDFVAVDTATGETQDQEEPSMETKMHMGIYKTRNNINCVFHSQPFFTTFVSCTNLEVDTKLIPESMAYIDKVCRVPYNHPGSHELADEVTKAIENCDAIILNNHGAICAKEDMDGLLLLTETLEFLCRLTAFSKITEIELNFLPQELKEDFLKHLEDLKP